MEGDNILKRESEEGVGQLKFFFFSYFVFMLCENICRWQEGRDKPIKSCDAPH